MNTTEMIEQLGVPTTPAPVTPTTPAVVTDITPAPFAESRPGKVDFFAQAAAEVKALVGEGGVDIAADVEAAEAQTVDQWIDTRPRNPDGTFAPQKAPEALEAEAGDSLDPVGDPAAAGTPEATATDAVEVLRIPDRNGQELELEVTDPRIAEAIRMNLNDGMRKAEFQRQLEPVLQDKRELKEFKANLQLNPEHVVLHMGPEAQLKALKILMATHFDPAKETAQAWYDDDLQRREFIFENEQTAAKRAQAVKAEVSVDERVDGLAIAINSLIPDWATQQDADDFWAVATHAVSAADQTSKGTLSKDKIPEVLDRHLRRFGFDKPAAVVPAPPPAPTPPGSVAVPKGPAAETVAARARATAVRMKQVASQQQAVAAIAPAGAGTPAVVIPPPRTWDEAAERVKQSYRDRGLQ